jgi:uncharacterized protein (TIGR01777 family)
MNVAQSWEKSFLKTNTPKTLKTALRTSIVLGKNGGAFVPLKKLTLLGLGGKQGKGNQFISWIHEDDFARALQFIIENKMASVVNIVSPQPISNQDFMATLRKQSEVWFGIPTPEFLLRIGAQIIGTETELILKSRNVIPTRLVEHGFKFSYPTIEATFQNLLK